MDIRVITLRYQEGTHGFPEAALRQAIAGRDVLEAREQGSRLQSTTVDFVDLGMTGSCKG